MDKIWYSVETPNVFREVALPSNDDDWSEQDQNKYFELQELAERYGTSIKSAANRRG